MRFHQGLDQILNSRPKVGVLRLLCRTGGEISGRQMAKMLRLSPMTAHKALKELFEERVIDKRSMGRLHAYSLNEKNRVVSRLLKPLFAAEDSLFDDVLGVIRRRILASPLKEGILSCALFGSVLEKNERPTSDIDLFIVVKNGAMKRAVEGLMTDINRSLAPEIGMSLSPYINSLNEFRAKKKAGLPVIRAILRSHRVMAGEKPEKLL